MSRSALTPFALIGLVCIAGSTLTHAENVKGYANSTGYLALGDSVAFGYTPLARKPGILTYYSGYPDIVSKETRLKVANASCFGESTGHFLSLQAPDTGCQAWRDMFRLFADYNGTQMDFAVDYLEASRKAQLITIDIGANDLGVLLQDCFGDPTCFGAGLKAALATYGANLTTIFSRIRYEAHYTGPIVAVTTYAVNYANQSEVVPIAALNDVLATVAPVFGVQIADAFAAFGAASIPFSGDACAAGLLIPLAPGVCNIHPSAAGQALIAQTVLALVSK
jgi:lysophospholipase L1-like esterase